VAGWNEYLAKAEGVNRHNAWYTSPYPLSRSVVGLLVPGWTSWLTHSRRVRDNALYKSIATFLRVTAIFQIFSKCISGRISPTDYLMHSITSPADSPRVSVFAPACLFVCCGKTLKLLYETFTVDRQWLKDNAYWFGYELVQIHIAGRDLLCPTLFV